MALHFPNHLGTVSVNALRLSHWETPSYPHYMLDACALFLSLKAFHDWRLGNALVVSANELLSRYKKATVSSSRNSSSRWNGGFG